MIRGHTIGSRGDLVKYLALVAACLLTVALGAPATADDPDPVQVTFPDVTELNPALGRLVNNTGDDGGAASG